MLGKFVAWFVCFGLSFLVQNWEWTEQGKAFLYIHIGVSVFFVLLPIVLLIISGMATKFPEKIGGTSFIVILITTAVIGVTLFATWGATKLFNVDFYVVYQIMTFGQCLCPNKKEKNK